MNYPLIDPVIFHLGPLAVRWYGLMYVLGFGAFYLLALLRIRRGATGWSTQQVGDLLFYGVVGVVIGGRLGSVVFYGFDAFLRDPLSVLRVWEGGMSFHGGLLGAIAAVWVFARKTERRFFAVTDFVAPLAPVGLGLGRIGNFINAELPGRVTDLPIGVHFPCDSVRGINLTCFADYEAAARHVSSLYQALAEGVVLFALVWLFAARPRAAAQVSGVFLLGYGALRFLTEFVREPDPNKGFVAFDWLTMGQLLSIPMLLAGIALLLWRRRRRAA